MLDKIQNVKYPIIEAFSYESKIYQHFTNKCNGVNSLRLHNLSDDTVSVMLKTNAC